MAAQTGPRPAASSPPPPTADATTMLREAGLRVTSQRLAVIEILRAHPHADVDLLATQTRKRVGSVSNQAIYEMVKVFQSCGLITRLDVPGGSQVFELNTGDHTHLVCTSCGRIDHASPSKRLPHGAEAGWLVTAATLSGICPACAELAAAV